MLSVTNLNAFPMSLEEDLFPTPLQHHSSFCSTTDHGPTRGIARSGIGRCHSHLRKSPFRCSQFQHLESFLTSLAYQSAPILPSLQWRWERHWHWTLADLPIWECDCIGAQWNKCSTFLARRPLFISLRLSKDGMTFCWFQTCNILDSSFHPLVVSAVWPSKPRIPMPTSALLGLAVSSQTINCPGMYFGMFSYFYFAIQFQFSKPCNPQVCHQNWSRSHDHVAIVCTITWVKMGSAKQRCPASRGGTAKLVWFDTGYTG